MSMAEEYVAKIKDLDPSNHPDEVIISTDCKEVVSREFLEAHRWYNILRSVYRCTDGSHFEITWEDPATEIQEGQDYNAQACLVEPREVTVIKYFEIGK